MATFLAFACAPNLIIDPVHHECVHDLTKAAWGCRHAIKVKIAQGDSDCNDEEVHANFQDRKDLFNKVMVEFDLTIKLQYLHKRDDICRALETLHIALDPFSDGPAVSGNHGRSPMRLAADDAVGAAEDQTTMVKLLSGARLSLSEVFMSYTPYLDISVAGPFPGAAVPIAAVMIIHAS
ncbi:hypothetical protein AURDEDRAFT_170226 [Auricularia subglabra TFB-10046 SS5]|nr:hypothetical protein AURDEDRAFT_170226 [Auricularia subglabra TFB-10046 SS5]